ncbi:hypothetical protein PMN64_28400 [Bradyrhizobium sp. UFLA01-814]
MAQQFDLIVVSKGFSAFLGCCFVEAKQVYAIGDAPVGTEDMRGVAAYGHRLPYIANSAIPVMTIGQSSRATMYTL